MIYIQRDMLTCYTMKNETDTVSFDALIPLLMSKPSNMIYCESGRELCGIISMGDIRRAHSLQQNFVIPNRLFTKVNSHEYMKVRQIFKDAPSINALPIVDTQNHLIAAYSRWEDFTSHMNFDTIINHPSSFSFWSEAKHIALVRPSNLFQNKMELMLQWYTALTQTSSHVDIIERTDILDTFDAYDYVLFSDQDELRGTLELYYSFYNLYLPRTKFKTYLEMKQYYYKYIIGSATQALFSYLVNHNIDVVNIQTCDNHSLYWDNLKNELLAKYAISGNKKSSDLNSLTSEQQKDFFLDLYNEEYANSISRLPFEIEKRNGISKLCDSDTPYYHIYNGERLTVDQPEAYTKTIHFFGPCLIVGAFVEDQYTIESYLQRELNQNNLPVRVVNYGCWSSRQAIRNRIAQTTFHSGDILVYYCNANSQSYDGVYNLNLTDICEHNGMPASWFIDALPHCNHKANSFFADSIFVLLKNNIINSQNQFSKEVITYDDPYNINGYLLMYFHDFLPSTYSKVGSIVMNCNPFTKGHRYLVEQALRHVDFLIIFVVEENQSIFPFEERFSMVVNGTSDLKNIRVVPSGNFILSNATFPEYFLKIEDHDLIQNVEYDITLFAEQIAPRLNITYRFVGEEPFDSVTNEYNNAMKKILPQHGIKLIEIPRLRNNLATISATTVRGILETTEQKQLEDFVPLTTLHLIDYHLQ